MSRTRPSPPRPRVLHFVTHLGLGGAERVALTIAKNLRETCDFGIYAAQGQDADAVGRSMGAELTELGITLHTGTRMPIKAGGLLLAGIKAARAVAQFRPDLIHLHTEIPEATYAVMTCWHPRLAAIPLVRTIHNSVYWHHWPKLGRWCERRMPKAHIATVSQDARQAFEKHRARANAGVLPAPPVVVYNGVAEPVFSAREVRAPGSPLRLLFAGRFDEQKGADLLPQILPLIRLEPGRSGELDLYGSGRTKPALAALAADPPSGWTVRLQAPVADLSECFEAHDLVLLPSRFEGCSLVAIEAMLAGVPVVATDGRGLHETLPPTYPWIAAAGNAASFAQAVQRAMDERHSWPTVASETKAFAQGQFSLSRMCAAYRRLYDQALVGSTC